MPLRIVPPKHPDRAVNDALVLAARAASRDMVHADAFTDAELADLALIFPAWKVGVAYAVGDLVSYGRLLYAVLQAHTSQADWPPPDVPALFLRKAAPGTVPDWVQPAGGHDAYNIGDRVKHNGHLWESTINANVWEPGVYGWTDLGPL
jgi:hypothetical protein